MLQFRVPEVLPDVLQHTIRQGRPTLDVLLEICILADKIL